VTIIAEVTNPESILTLKHDTLARFIQLIQPLAQVYKLPLTTLHVFHDNSRDLIAFNRNASIFLNLWYFEARREWNKYDSQTR
jgi:hypothetical protein